MKSYRNTDERERTIRELMNEFRKGQQWTVNDIVVRKFDPKTLVMAMKAEEIVRGWMRTIKSRFNKEEGRAFGCVGAGGRGVYGVANTTAEHLVMLDNSYKLIKGTARNARSVLNNAHARGLLLHVPDEQITIPSNVEAPR